MKMIRINLMNRDYLKELDVDFDVEDYAYKLVKPLIPCLQRKYCVRFFSILETISKLKPIIAVTKGNIKGKKIIDLGCGTDPPLDQNHFGMPYQPNLCRLLHELEAKPIGIDLDNEEFVHYYVDLMEKDSLKFLPASSIDVAIAIDLFTSPSFEKQYGTRAGKRLEENLTSQLERIVRPNGYFLHNGN